MLENDPLGRKWVEPDLPEHLRDGLRTGLINFIAFEPSTNPRIVGSGFVIGVDETKQFLFAITAKHVIEKGVLDIQQPHNPHASSALKEFLPKRIPSIDKNKLRVAWVGSDIADMMIVRHVTYNDDNDLALCLLEFQEHRVHGAAATQIELDTAMPKAGEEVCIISLTNFSCEQTEIQPQTIQLGRKVSVRLGRVTEVYPHGYNQYTWPCFRTNVPVLAGMSGGLVSRLLIDTVTACGVVTADLGSSENSLNNFTGDGGSLISCIWPIVGLKIPHQITTDSFTERTILDCILAGEMRDHCADNVKYNIVDKGNGAYEISRILTSPSGDLKKSLS